MGKHNRVTIYLTKREKEIVRLSLLCGNQLIADKLFISKRTVDFHLVNAFKKLGVHRRVDAWNKATRRGLL